MVVFPDTMYTFRDTGSKLITFSHILLLSQHPVDPNIACADSEEGQGALNPLEKHKLYGII